MKISKLLIFVICASVIVVPSWIFLIVPELKASNDLYEVSYENFGTIRISENLGDELSEPITTFSNYKRNVVGVVGNQMELFSTLEYRNFETGELFYDLTFTELLDKHSRKYIDKNGYAVFPPDLKKQNYDVFDAGDGSTMHMEFVGTDDFEGLEVYKFVGEIEIDISEVYPEIELPVYEQLKITTWNEAETGLEIIYEEDFTDFVIIDDEKIPITVVESTASNLSKSVHIQSTKNIKKLFYQYDYVIPAFLMIGSVGAISGVAIRDKLKTQTKKFADLKKKRTEDILYEQIRSPIITFDQNYLFVDCNDYFLEKTGYSKNELLGKQAYEFLAEEDAEIFHNVIGPSIKTKTPLIDIDLHVIKKDGNFFHALWSHIYNFDENNEFLGFTAIGLDLSELDSLRNELLKNEKLSTVGHLASNLAHDLKNPLASMKSSLEIIKQIDKDNPIFSQEIERTDRVINRIEHQIDQVLNYVKSQPLQTSESSINKIINQSLISINIPENISLQLPPTDFTIKWDETQISVVFTNIILNAIQAIGKDDGQISIDSSQTNDTITVEIKNSGPNIPESDLEMIFEPLFTTKLEGTGLGLSGTKNIIMAHGGTIHAKTNPVRIILNIPRYV